MLFHSPLTMMLLMAAAILMFIGARAKKGHILSFFGALTGVCAACIAILTGCGWLGALVCILLCLLANLWGRGRNG